MEETNNNNNIYKKKQEILKILDEIKEQSKLNKKKSSKYRRLHNGSNALINFSNACGISSLITTIASFNPVPLIIGSACMSISTITSATSNALSFNDKYIICRTTYTQLEDLNRQVRSQLLKNHLTSEQYDEILEEMAHTISLINDSSIY